MAKKISPAPISTNLNSGGQTNLPWTLWLSNVSDYLTNSTKINVKGNVNYTTIGNVCFFNVSGNVTKISLPFKSMYKKHIQVFKDGALEYIELSADSSEFVISGNVDINDFYIIKYE